MSCHRNRIPRLKAQYNDEIQAQLQENSASTTSCRSRARQDRRQHGCRRRCRSAEGCSKARSTISRSSPARSRRHQGKKTSRASSFARGRPSALKVTLRGDRMWEFLDRLISLAIPRIRDFRGLPTKSFDGRGNYTFGVTEQLIFPEINYDNVDVARGMDITIVTTATNNEHGKALLEAFALPVPEGRPVMAKKALVNKQQKTPKFKVRAYTRCRKCGRPRSVYKKFGLCRICLREMGHAGEIPGLKKASW